jgi:hypothetical protein
MSFGKSNPIKGSAQSSSGGGGGSAREIHRTKGRAGRKVRPRVRRTSVAARKAVPGPRVTSSPTVMRSVRLGRRGVGNERG